MGALLVLGLLGLAGVFSISAGDDLSEPDPVEPLALSGTAGQDDLLIGGSGDDTLIGNADEPDVLEGRGGDDLLILQDENLGTGGAGHDVFDVTDGQKAVITDFDPEEDALQVLFLRNEVEPDADAALTWRITSEGAELHALNRSENVLSETTHLVTLMGLTAPPDEGAVHLTARRP